MGKYGEAAIRATQLVTRGKCKSVSEAWNVAAREIFPNKLPAQKKGCPRGAFLGLCEEGLVSGVPTGMYTKSRDNKRYAVEAVHLLERQPDLAVDHATLWKKIMKGKDKVENGQMDVVLTLWSRDLIARNKA